jgi:protein-tyrosine phosphatase
MGAIAMTGPVWRLEGVGNFRDLGGGLTADGRRVAPHRLFRSGSLHRMTDRDRATLEACGITTVIDLRSPAESRQQPYVWEATTAVPAPLADDRVVADMMQRFEAGTITSAELEDWWSLTRVFQAPEEQVASLRTIFSTLIALPSDEAVLIHCRGGKDRTGMVAALVLDSLGVRREDVMADFLLTNDAARVEPTDGEIAAFFERFPWFTPEAVAAMQGVRAEWLDSLFAGIAERYGSAPRYLADHVGIGEVGVRQLRANYLRPV